MTMMETAKTFFEACETGKGWKECAEYCQPDASFSCQAAALAGVLTLEMYAEWVKGLLTPIPDGRYEPKSFAIDEERSSALVFAVFHGTHTGDGGPVSPTGKGTASDYGYSMEFAGGKIAHMTKIWNDSQALADLGWT